MLNDVLNMEKMMIQNQMGTLADLEETNYYEIINVLSAKEHDEFKDAQLAGGTHRDKNGNEVVPLGFMWEDGTLGKQ